VSNLLNNLPKMNTLLMHPLLSGIGTERAKHAGRETLDKLRSDVLSGTLTQLPSLDECARIVAAKISEEQHNLRGVINATGIVLHTNLGRAPLGKDLISGLSEVFEGYSNLEYDLTTGNRGSRYSHIETLLCEITGAEASMVVNNNAAAMMLVLATLAKGKKVAVSRGELVEIGGSFRVPQVIVQGGAELVEVGTTNKTSLADYVDAVENQNAQVLLKVHTSNYEVVGFTSSVPAQTLVQYGKSVGLPVIYDVGACFLIDTEPFGFSAGETAMSWLSSGADVVCFSGDKLLGCSQAGIISGRADLIAAMKKHPLTRAIRPDKLTLSVLEAALRLYRFPKEAAAKIPVLSMLFAGEAELNSRAVALADRLRAVLSGWEAEVIEVMDETGGGSLPNVPLPGWAVSLSPCGLTVNELEEKLRGARRPIIIRIQYNKALISVRTLLPGDDDAIVKWAEDAASSFSAG